jgi:metal-responsive CopG/Arc/MetJ family transcriptional regulator
MRASVTLDDALLRKAHEYTGIAERAELIREALKSIIAREAGRRLLALAGAASEIKDVPRRKLNRKSRSLTRPSGLSCFVEVSSTQSWNR